MAEIILAETASTAQPAAAFGSFYLDNTANPQLMLRDDTAAAISISDTRNTQTISGAKTFTNLVNPTTAAGTNSAAAMTMTAGTNLTSATAGAWEFDGKVAMFTPVAAHRGVVGIVEYSIVPAGNFSLQVAAGVQSCFPTAGDVFTLPANTTYWMEGHYNIIKATTAITTAMAFAFSNAPTLIRYYVINHHAADNVTVSTATATTANLTEVAQAASTVVSASVATNLSIFFKGLVRTNLATTFTPQVSWSGTATATPAMAAGSFIFLTPLGTDTQNIMGNVAKKNYLTNPLDRVE